MAEWFKAHAWKACIQQCIGGSNPFFSASETQCSKAIYSVGFFISSEFFVVTLSDLCRSLLNKVKESFFMSYQNFETYRPDYLGSRSKGIKSKSCGVKN